MRSCLMARQETSRGTCVAQNSSHHDLWSVPFVLRITIFLAFQLASTVFDKENLSVTF